MSSTGEISTGRKIWEMVNPFVFMIVCMIICTMAATSVIMTVSLMQGSMLTDISELSVKASLISEMIFYAAVIVIKYRSIGYDKYKYGHSSKNWPILKCVAAAAAAFGISMVLNYLIAVSGIDNLFPTYENSAAALFSGQSPVILIITVVILGPIAEEIIFRWMIFGRIRCYYGSKWAILFSSLLFGIYHMNVVQFIFCTLLGIVFAYLYDKSGNIFITIAAHMAVNMVGVLGFI